MVWKDLDRLGLSGIGLHSSSHGKAELERNKANGTGRQGKKLKFDSYGPYVWGTSPKFAHYALRFEVYSLKISYLGSFSNCTYQLEPDQGKSDDLNTWQYFGLVQDSSGRCVLSENRFWCPDGRDAIWDSRTDLDLESIKNRG